ncbi:MAG: EamA family transporter [Chitinophagaceae bacterium]|nr:EamA family transporter [Chitinophagaceae bacterium]MCW5905387.1 EamA family transporter [Chitinophagaceae bacterium]
MKSALIKLHASVFLWGFTGVLGKAIQLNEGLLVWYRLLIAVLVLWAIFLYKKPSNKLPLKNIVQLAGIGVILTFHWVFFYGSIKYANVSIALVCLSSAGVFTAILEPLMTGKRINPIEVLLGLIAVAGIYLIFHFDVKFRTGIIIGICATLFSVIFSVFSKKAVATTAPKTMMLYQLTGGFIALTLLMPYYMYLFPSEKLLPSSQDFLWLLILSLVCTIFTMDLSLHALKKISAFTQNLTLNLEPVYGILLAFIIYKENKDLSNTFYIGFALIFSTVAIQMIRVVKHKSTI